MIYQTEKSLGDLGDKIGADEKSKIEAAVADLKKALEGGNVEEIKAKNEALKQASYKLAEEVYKQQAAEQGAGAGPDMGAGPGGFDDADRGGADAGSQSSGDDSAEDADYEVVDE